MGGLGNQMFQYTFALGHLTNGKKVKFDITNYENGNRYRSYLLDKAFDLNLEKADKRDFFYFMEKVKSDDGSFGYQLKDNRFFIEEDAEEEFTYNPDLIDLDDTYFSGYWQNINYFRKNENEIRTHFTFKPIDSMDMYNIGLKEQIMNSNSVSIHIRRGDYLQSPIHLNLELEYYRNAITYIKQYIENSVFYIFTDDMEWVKANLLIADANYVEDNINDKCHLDMYLMSLCKHNIIANSTFSWWGAWLNKNPEKIVVTPKKWFSHIKDISGLMPRKWIKL